MVLALVAAVVVLAIVEIGRRTDLVVQGRPFVVIPVAALLVGGLAIAFAPSPDNRPIWSSSRARRQWDRWSIRRPPGHTWNARPVQGAGVGISLGSARGGPTFPPSFLGIVGASWPGTCRDSPRPAWRCSSACCVAVLAACRPLSSPCWSRTPDWPRAPGHRGRSGRLHASSGCVRASVCGGAGEGGGAERTGGGGEAPVIGVPRMGPSPNVTDGRDKAPTMLRLEPRVPVPAGASQDAAASW